MAPIKKGELSESEKKLFDIVLKGTVEEIRAILKEPDVRVDCLDQTGMTLLQHAAFKGRYEMCEVFLAHGGDVNSNYHDNGYSALMFAALSGNTEVTRLMLQAGAKVHHINSVNRTASQMAAFVGQHQCVSVINNFFPKEDIEYYTVPQGLEKEAKLPAAIAPSLLTLVNSVNMHPVKIALYMKDHKELQEEWYKVTRVLDLLVERNMKSRETNDVLALKLHYLATIIRNTAKAALDKDGDTEPWIKSLLKGRDGDAFPEKQERLIRQSLKEFPYVESQLLQQVVRQIAPVKMGEGVTALSMLMASINGQQYGWDEDTSCSTCGTQNPEKKCSACKMVGYCNQQCQKLHWFTHKKFCKQLAEEYVRREEVRKKREAEEKRQQEEAQKKKAEEEQAKEEEGKERQHQVDELHERMKEVGVGDLIESQGCETKTDSNKKDEENESGKTLSSVTENGNTSVTQDTNQTPQPDTASVAS
ncbi:ankyrin repeat and MYND domain-containing protein 2-like isoform X1 [Haliotis cracherodii]|uniref:ankyrin repeat and MYND domain-containing protein 2-like isoform X1 n=1 Tax=Haliotis cracherodii TaxID=6455 RepID=UPI0039E9412F